MASLTQRTATNASPEAPELPSRDSDGFKDASQRTLQARALVRPRDNDDANSLDLEGLQVSSVEEWEEEGVGEGEGEGEGESKMDRKKNEKGEGGGGEMTSGEREGGVCKSLTSRHRMQTSKSLADFKAVDEAVKHAVDKGVTLPQAFQQLSYRNSQVQIVNEGVLLHDPTTSPTSTPASATASIEPMKGAELSPSSRGSPICLPFSKRKSSTSTSKKNSKKKSTSSHVDDLPAKTISAPSIIKHQMHVQFNPEFCRYEGLSEVAAKSGANQQFGVILSSVPKCDVDGYVSKIPAILLLLWKKVVERQGEQSVGIFRLAADADEMKWVKEQLNTGQYDGDVIEENIAATLIKIFFRQLPTNLLNHIDRSVIDKIADYDEMLTSPNQQTAELIFEQLRAGLQEPQYSLLLWLLDTMGQVVTHKETNKMSAKNMAIVIAPNLYSIVDLSNPMAAMTWTQRIARFAEVVLTARMQVRPPSVVASMHK